MRRAALVLALAALVPTGLAPPMPGNWSRGCGSACGWKAVRDQAEGLPAELLRLDAAGGSPGTSALALACLGDTDAAVERMVAALAAELWRVSAVDLLRAPYAHEMPPFVTLRPLLARPEVAEALAAVARDLPERLR